jgi:hypothetical protein
MGKDWDQRLFDEWLSLREQFRDAKRNKEYVKTIDLCMAILALNKRAKFIRVMTPLFHKEIGNAYLRLTDYPNALRHLQNAKDDFVEYRKNNELRHPDDWLKDISSLERRIRKIKVEHLLC